MVGDQSGTATGTGTGTGHGPAGATEVGCDVPLAPGFRGPLGFLPLLGRGLLPALLELGAAGPVVRLRIGPASKYVVSDPALAREILTDQCGTFGRQSMVRGFRPVTGDGLFTLDGSTHRHHRRVMAPAFSRASLAATTPLLCAAAVDFARRWPSDTPLDIDREMLKLAADLTVRALFRADAPLGTIAWLASKASTLSKAVQDRMVAPTWLPPVPTPGLISSRRAARRLREVVQVLSERHTPAEGGNDVLSLLRAAVCPVEGSPALSRAAVVDELVTLLVASSEATAMTLAWAWHELARNPEIEQAVQQEADDLFGSGNAPQGKVLDRLPVASAVTQEVLRFYPIPVVPREVLREVYVGGFRLPAGAEILLNFYSIHRDPAQYTRPEIFDPHRWSPSAARMPSHEAYLPFSTGAHRCIGAPFAAISVPIALAVLAARFQLRPTSPERPVRPVGGVVTRPDRLVMTATARTPFRRPAPCSGQEHTAQEATTTLL